MSSSQRNPSLVREDLSTRIFKAERAVIERDERVAWRVNELTDRWRRVARRGTSLRTLLAVGAVSVGAAMLVRGRAGRRGRPSRSRTRRPHLLATLPWARLLPLMWPLMPLGVRSRVNPHLATTALAFVGGHFMAREKAEPETRSDARTVDPVAQVSLERYLGRWYEVARLPFAHEADCAGEVSASYERVGEGIEIVNRCRLRDGRWRVARGMAQEVQGSRGARLKVSFAPQWLHWLPTAWADYWILDVDAHYRSALVGTPDREQLWLLSRSPRMSEMEFRRLMDIARAQGFDVERVQLTRQDG
jgi:apolipoprotein D and lipocalin family protein